MSSKKDFSNKILHILSKKSVISLDEIQNNISFNTKSKNDFYAVTRSLKGLREAGLIEQILSVHSKFIRLTKDGKKKIYSLSLDNDTTLVNISWDGFWRIILLDLPEKRKNERESLRYLLKKAGFVCLKNSAWISPFPFEYLFTNIKKDLKLTTEMIIIVTQFLDEETKKFLFETFKK